MTISTSEIHSTAIIDKTAIIEDGVKIHAYAVIGPNAKIAAGTEIFPQAYLEHCEIGKNCVISAGAIIGTPPQDLSYKNEPSKAIIGDGCLIREHVTVNRASGEGNVTTVGNECMLMTGAHVAHNCKVGNNVVIANIALLGGFVEIGDYCFIGGSTVFHQFVRVGEMAIVGGFTGTRQDLPPYSKIDGREGRVMGTNSVGLKRRGLSLEERSSLKNAFKYIWFSNLNTQNAIEKIREEIPSNQYIENLIKFMEPSKRGVTKLAGKHDTDV
jgi:UDP-N-acetylglucosamine acyltransferase